MRILILFLFLNANIQAQISGQIIDVTGTLTGVKIELTGNNTIAETDFDGNFSIEIPENLVKSNILLKYDMITVKIENVNFENKKEIDFGKFVMPYFKVISLDEYENFTETKKKNCEPIYSWNHSNNELIAYSFFNELSEKFITWNFGKVEKKIFDFKYDKQNKTITVDWNTILEYK